MWNVRKSFVGIPFLQMYSPVLIIQYVSESVLQFIINNDKKGKNITTLFIIFKIFSESCLSFASVNCCPMLSPCIYVFNVNYTHIRSINQYDICTKLTSVYKRLQYGYHPSLFSCTFNNYLLQ